MNTMITIVLSCFIFSFVYATTPDTLAAEYYGHLHAENWDKLGDYYSDKALEEFRDLFGIIVEIPSKGDREEVIELLFGEKTTAEDIIDMSDKDFFNAMMKGIDALIGSVALMNYNAYDVIGGVQETETLMHVVSRCRLNIDVKDNMDFAPMTMEIMEVLSFEKVNSTWKMLLDPKIRALAQQIRSAMDL